MLQRIKFRVLHILIKCSATELQSGPGTFGFVCINLMHCLHYLFKDFILLMCVQCGEGCVGTQSVYGGRRTTLWNLCSSSTFMWIPGIELRSLFTDPSFWPHRFPWYPLGRVAVRTQLKSLVCAKEVTVWPSLSLLPWVRRTRGWGIAS